MDITKCENDQCPQKNKCLRWTAPADYLQSYAHFDPNGEFKCFWPNGVK